MKKVITLILCLGLFVAISHRAHAQEQQPVVEKSEVEKKEEEKPKEKTAAELQEEALFKPFKMDPITIEIEYKNKKKFLDRMKLQTQAILEVLGYEKEKAVASFRSSVYSESQQNVKETKENDAYKFASQFDSKVYVVSSNEVQCPYHVISDSVSEHSRRIRVAKVEINCTIFPKRTEIKKPEEAKKTNDATGVTTIDAKGKISRSDNESYNQCVDLYEAYTSEPTSDNKLQLVTKFRNGCGRCLMVMSSNGSDNYVMKQYQYLSSPNSYHFLRINGAGDIAMSSVTSDSWLSMELSLDLIPMVLKLGYCNPDSSVY